MMVEELETDAQRGEWDRFVASRDESSLGHDSRWLSILEDAFGHEPHFLMARDSGGNVTGILPLVLVEGLVGGRALVSLPWLDIAGLLVQGNDASHALLARASSLARDRDCRYLELRALSSYEAPRPIETHKVLMRRAVQDREALWKSFSAKVRNQIRKAEKEGLRARIGTADELDRFYFVFSRNMRDLGVPVWGMDFFASILDRFRGDAKLVFVESDQEPVGAALLIVHKNVALVPSASSLRSWFRSCPNHLLYWEAFQEAHRMGADTFDFGRSSPDSGTHHFKKQWGSEEVPCFWHYDLVKMSAPPQRNTASPKLKLAVETWKRLPLAITNRLGPILVRRIP